MSGIVSHPASDDYRRNYDEVFRKRVDDKQDIPEPCPGCPCLTDHCPCEDEDSED